MLVLRIVLILIINIYSCSTSNESVTIHTSVFGNKEYFISGSEAGYFQAHAICSKLGMRPVTIMTSQINEFLLHDIIDENLTANAFWTAGSTVLNKDVWNWLTYVIKFEYNQLPENLDDVENKRCLKIMVENEKTLKWVTEDCSKANLFMCEQYVKQEPFVDLLESFKNPLGLIENMPIFNDNEDVHFVINYMKESYHSANQICHALEMELLYIESEEENEMLKDYIKSAGTDSGAFWSSGHRIFDKVSWYWLGSAMPLEYTNWAIGKPEKNENYCLKVELGDEGLTWSEFDCTARLPFICKADLREHEDEDGEEE
ncbi:unnamed protein product [Psylliodes chrysocephalus]|uniref:C-type lectin domain-containing protein n=1 Tax=Psylliodes chrysocephalus TaxID=3402493 RepID=A0A9P0G2Z1_9CUCU|nr:unnamed protein product [Psylliodes chrysocephala]